MKAFYLPAEHAFLRYLDVPGDDPPLLWLHGWQCSSTGELAATAVQPPLRGRRSLLIDLLGHGYSDKPADFPYTIADHARTIVALIDGVGITECGLVGHSMGGAIAIYVADARPEVVNLLVMAEGAGDFDPDWDPFDGQSEQEFIAHGLADLVAGQQQAGEAEPGGVAAVHAGIARALEPRAVYRESVSMATVGDPTTLTLLGKLTMPRCYVQGALSDPEPQFERDLAALGVNWKTVPDTGHAFGIQNPLGFARAIAEAAHDRGSEQRREGLLNR